MASVLPQEMKTTRAVTGSLGKSLLDVITSGMYSDPRMAIREYIQNAVDSIDLATNQGLYAVDCPRVKVSLDGLARTITVEDNGLGIDGADVDRRLGSLGCSTKVASGLRGFRGIGRLGGLAYCDTLRFETRRTSREPVHVVEWSGQALREQVSHDTGQEQLGDAVQRIACVGTRRADRMTDPDRFFRVRMHNVHRFHADLLMNVKGLRDYLAQTAPVSCGQDGFPFASQIEKHLADLPGYRVYDVVLNGESVVRPYCVDIAVRSGCADHIRDIELVEFRDRKGQMLCKGWYAQSGFLSALPQYITMRGMRIRQGNIAVGDEYFLKELFAESRFATWHIGELHVAPLLKLNARRDGFEESVEYEDFLERASMLCRQLGGMCRQSSKDRSSKQTVTRLRHEFELSLAIPFFVDENHEQLLVDGLEQQLTRLRRLVAGFPPDEHRSIDALAGRFAKFREKSLYLRDIIDGRALRGKNNRELLVDLCSRMRSVNHGPDSWKLLFDVVRPYLKAGY